MSLLDTVETNNQRIYDAGYIKGLSEIPSGGTWTKLADITTTEEVNSIIATAEEFPDMPKCKEFIIRGVFPKSPTGENISLGALRVDFNNSSAICYYFGGTNINKDAIVENRIHSVIADGLVFSVGTETASGQGAIVTQTKMLIGERFLSGDVTEIKYRLSTATNVFPIGTRLYIYGKVEG